MIYSCFVCGQDVNEDDTVWVYASDGRATTTGESCRVCAVSDAPQRDLPERRRLYVDIYRDGQEDEDSLASCYAFDGEVEEN